MAILIIQTLFLQIFEITIDFRNISFIICGFFTIYLLFKN